MRREGWLITLCHPWLGFDAMMSANPGEPRCKPKGWSNLQYSSYFDSNSAEFYASMLHEDLDVRNDQCKRWLTNILDCDRCKPGVNVRGHNYRNMNAIFIHQGNSEPGPLRLNMVPTRWPRTSPRRPNNPTLLLMSSKMAAFLLQAHAAYLTHPLHMCTF